MKTILKFLAVLWLGITLSIMINTESKAQVFNKKEKIEVASDVKAIIVNGLVVDVYDFTGQLDKFESIKLQIIADGGSPPDPEFTIIKDDRKGIYRLAETLQEINLQSDNLNVFKRKASEIYDNKRKKFN